MSTYFIEYEIYLKYPSVRFPKGFSFIFMTKLMEIAFFFYGDNTFVKKKQTNRNFEILIKIIIIIDKKILLKSVLNIMLVQLDISHFTTRLPNHD